MSDLPNKAHFRPDEVAVYFSVAPSTVYGWINQGIIEAQKIGGTLRITRQAIINAQKSAIE
jgi:excisionase family DNA binding protein